MKFTTDRINVFGGMLQVQVPFRSIDDLIALQECCSKGKKITVELKRERRSRDANAYCWVLCHSIAKKLSKEHVRVSAVDVYRKAISECGHCTILPIRETAVDHFKHIWTAKGIGWIVEDLGASKLSGYVNVAAYHGSSTYDTAEMARLIDGLVEEAKAVGAETLPPAELARLKDEWGDNDGADQSRKR
ncbi:MAG: hypothetical protein IJZ69_04385 [Bacteroidales bacterium]|nr:hypothetical protein [Bacteroidales bacterium]MBQ8809552.1 hypothetical protein [Bacteroidales bacterium]